MEVAKRKGLTTFDLKVIGIIFMFIDHIHQMFALMGAPTWLDWFGRPVATLFFFVSVEGFSHTRNKNKYLLRLLIGFWLMGFGTGLVQRYFSVGNMALQNNIFADLFVGALGMYGIDFFKKFKDSKQIKELFLGLTCFLLPIIISVIGLLGLNQGNISVVYLMRLTPATIFTENNVLVYLMPILYLFKDNRKIQSLVIGLVACLFLFRSPSEAFTVNTQWMMIFSLIPIGLYNGEKGRGMKYFFYVFYPAHIWILYIIASFIYNH